LPQSYLMTWAENRPPKAAFFRYKCIGECVFWQKVNPNVVI